MKRLFATFLVAGLFALTSIAAASAGTSAPRANPDVLCDPTGCGGGGGGGGGPDVCWGVFDPNTGYTGYDYAGWAVGVPGIGQTYSTKISTGFITMRSNGHIAAWVGVDNNQGASSGGRWIQAGVTQLYGQALEFYIEYQTGISEPNNPNGYHFLNEGNVPSWNVPYMASVTKVANGVFKASVNGHSTGNINFVGPIGMNGTDFTLEDEVIPAGATCNIGDFTFSSMIPNRGTISTTNSNSQYWTTNLTSTGFEAVGSAS